MDPRNAVLAKNLVNYSVHVMPGEKVLIELNGLNGLELMDLIVKEVYKAGAYPFVVCMPERTLRELLLGADERSLTQTAEYDAARMAGMDAYIGIGGRANQSELSDVPYEKIELYNKFYSKPVHTEIRVAKTKWVVLRYPSPSMAQASDVSTAAYEDFFYNVCNLDYAKMGEAMQPLVELMERTDRVRLISPGTDITFSIKDIPVVKCHGLRNIPDGEVYTAPVRDSVNGVISFNTPSKFMGYSFDNIRLKFENGKIESADSNDPERINKILNTDEGSRYIGEFAIGVNPFITKAVNNTLFDEKITGSIHFTPGNAYKEAFNGNKSAIHWDLILIQTKESGGGEMYFDDVLVRKDGRFVLPELEVLNPENLM